MLKRRFGFLVLAAILLVGEGVGQVKMGEKDPSGVKESSSSGVSLLDPQRLSLSHSWGLYFSTGKASQSFALYRSSLRYRLAKPLTISVDLGYLHQPFKGDEQGKFILPRMGIEYKPNRFFDLRITIVRDPYLSSPLWGGRE